MLIDKASATTFGKSANYGLCRRIKTPNMRTIRYPTTVAAFGNAKVALASDVGAVTRIRKRFG